MDLSIQYIEMCKEAQEIQKLRNTTNQLLSGDFFNTKGDQPLDLLFALERCNGGELQDWLNIVIWLPRQDQLQQMRFGHEDNRKSPAQMAMIKEFMYNNKELYDSDPSNFPYQSMEQVWLAIIMKLNYNKTWIPSKKEWIYSTNQK